MHRLFHDDNYGFFDMTGLREKARHEVEKSSLFLRCAAGERAAVVAQHLGFWPFVYKFEKAIDERVNSSRLPREPLYEKFGRDATRQTLIDTARTVKNLEESEIRGVFDNAKGALLEMQKEERTHSFHWAKDAENLGISRAELEQVHIVPGVHALIAGTECDDLVEFFAKSLAATEFIAEEVGEMLAHNPAYKAQFKRQRTVWMEVHTIPHDDGPSHADIVLDFARAYNSIGSNDRIQMLVAQGIGLFGVAARDLENHFCPVSATTEKLA